MTRPQMTKLINIGIGWTQIFLVGGLTMLSTRIVLHELGPEDFGIYLASVSIALLFGILIGAATTLSQRSLAMVELKSGDLGAAMQVCFWQHFFLGLIILIVGGVLGIFFFSAAVVVPEKRADAAFASYMASILAMSLGAVAASFQAFSWAREDFSISMAGNILNATLALGVALVLSSTEHDKLVVYSVGTACVASFAQVLACLIVLYKYEASRIRMRLQWRSLPLAQGKELFAWNAVGSSAFILQQQSLVYMLNAFLGPNSTAAYGVANQATGAFRGLTQAVNSALAPTLYRSEASNARHELLSKAALNSKYLFLGACTLLLPVAQEAPYILDLWLVQPPTNAPILMRATLAAFALELLSSQYLIAWQAIGKISGLVVRSLVVTIVSLSLCWASLFARWDIHVVAAILALTGLINSLQRVALLMQHYRPAFADWLSGTVATTLPATAVVLVSAQMPAMFLDRGLVRLVVVVAVSSTLFIPIIFFNLRRDGIVRGPLASSKRDRGRVAGEMDESP